MEKCQSEEDWKQRPREIRKQGKGEGNDIHYRLGGLQKERQRANVLQGEMR